ncbi:MAG: hypothetical protein HOP11_10550 [Saprospiraceae bacterium]|nr:hypothetical protein [Saprospiraceae bacterium]
MKKNILLGLSIALLTMAGISAQYVHKAHDVQRIRHGIRTGELNRTEVRELRRENKKIMIAKQRASADGKITRKEARRISKMERKLDRTIYSQKHDCQRACRR